MLLVCMRITTALGLVIGVLFASGVFFLTAPASGVAFAAGQALVQGAVAAGLIIVGARVVRRALSGEKQSEKSS